MKIVIQCAGRKRGRLFQDGDGCEVFFVADPSLAPVNDGRRHVRPDDLAEDARSWRDAVVAYQKIGTNPMRLAQAYELYDNPVYRRFARHVGAENLYILSAGWGLIEASFLTPSYDVTFSRSVLTNGGAYKHRCRDAPWNDLCQLPDSDEPLLFFGGRDYLALFGDLTERYRGHRVVFYSSNVAPVVAGCATQRFVTSTRTNWHYGCANAFLDGEIGVTASPR